jgi:hypothetical protein
MARSFNGSTDKIVPANNLTWTQGNAYSFSCWSFLNTSHNAFDQIWAASGSGRTIGMAVHPFTSIGLNVYAEIAGHDSANNVAPTTNSWIHATGIITAGGISAQTVGIYYNGTFTSAGSRNFPEATFTSTSFEIGSSLGGNSFWTGKIADLALWFHGPSGVPLTALEDAAITAGARPSQIRPKDLVAYWPFDGLASPEPDLSGNKNNGTLTGTAQIFGPPFAPFTRRWPQFTQLPPPSQISVSYQRAQQILMTGP